METVIKYSKLKPVLLLLVSTAFAGICIWMLIESEGINLLGYAGFAFFFLLSVFIVYRLVKGGGIILSDKGIVSDRNHPEDSFINWDEIEKFSLREADGIKTINLHLYNPQVFLERQTRKNVRKKMEINEILYKAPVGITPHLLNISYKKLENLLIEKLESNQSSKKRLTPNNHD